MAFNWTFDIAHGNLLEVMKVSLLGNDNLVARHRLVM